MKELLAKIRSTEGKAKCGLVAQAYEQLVESVDNIEQQLHQAGANLEVKILDHDLDKLDQFAEELSSLFIPPEMKRFRENMERDYHETLEIWKFYELLNPDGGTYTADYAEYAGQKFAVPTSEEVLAKLKPEHLKLYQKMEKEGLEPKLQITPIAYNIRTLGEKIDAKKAQLKINTSDTYVWDEIKDEELQYAPTTIKAIKGGKEIEIKDGKTKSEWIKTNAGFLIDIVPTVEAIASDDSIQKDQKDQVNYNAIQAEKYAAKAKQEGLTPMSYESYLLAQMRALKAGKPLENNTYNLLLDSNLRSQYLAGGGWLGDSVRLFGNDADYRDDGLRLRCAVRVL